jgi:hypothetical protein
MIDLIGALRDGPLKDIFTKFPCTKQTHNYLPIYEMYFGPVRHDVRKVLEIGVEGGNSLRMWREYFPNAEIYGFDINEACRSHEADRIKIVIGDQGKPKDYQDLPDGFDIIIDDGSHIHAHQVMAFRHLFVPKMNQRGIYVCEDIVKSPQTINYFAKLSEAVNFFPAEKHNRQWPSLRDFSPYTNDEIILNTIGVAIHRHIVVVHKGRNPQDGHMYFLLNEREKVAEIRAIRAQFLEGAES